MCFSVRATRSAVRFSLDLLHADFIRSPAMRDVNTTAVALLFLFACSPHGRNGDDDGGDAGVDCSMG